MTRRAWPVTITRAIGRPSRRLAWWCRRGIRNGLKADVPRTLVLGAALITMWLAAAWFIADRYYLNRARALIEQERSASEERADELADNIRRNLNSMLGITDVLAQSPHVAAAVASFGADIGPSQLPVELRSQRWRAEPALQVLNQDLEIVQKSLNVDLIFVLNAAGDCVAANNAKAPVTLIGTAYGFRDYFIAARNGVHGMQYAVGAVSHIPGLFVSTPVIVNGEFLGVVAAKMDVFSLYKMIARLDAFVTDSNGIVILAHDKALEMHSMPGAAISTVGATEAMARYQRTEFPMLTIEPWGDGKFAALQRFGDEPGAHLLSSRTLPEFGIEVHIDKKLEAFAALQRDQLGFVLLLGTVGSLVIVVALSSFMHLRSITRSKSQLWIQAKFDTLTGLPNRDLLRDRLAEEITNSDRTGLPLALLLIDIDEFKDVNDTLGHDMGDLLLREAARRIAASVRRSDTVARLGGDEFIVMLPRIGEIKSAQAVAHDLKSALAQPFHLREGVIHVTASIGITSYPGDASDIDNLIKNADQAMYVSKRNGRNRVSNFTTALNEAAQKRMRLTKDLRVALAQGQFRVYYQPIVDLATGRVGKAEALLRWQHPAHGMISPLDFIPLAEETRLILDIGEWVRKESAAWCRHWNHLRPEGFQISVNQSPIEFTDDSKGNCVERLLGYLRDNGLPGSAFVVEITEGLLLNEDHRVTSKLAALRDAGVQVAIDDFGTGYSSLSYLKKFDIDYLKIDQSFVRNLTLDSNDLVLCQAIIVMAHHLGLKVVAEGVETAEQRDLLASSGCDHAQGFLFSRPLPPDELDVWLRTASAAAAPATRRPNDDLVTEMCVGQIPSG